VGYVGVFIALGGTAYTAKPLIRGANVHDGSLAEAGIATANRGATDTTPSLRIVGTGAQQAAADNDLRLSDARTPTGTAGGDLTVGTGNIRSG
jgi:trimeric autotransporter adhesin